MGPCRRNGNNEAMFKEVPYFCYSHLLALITVAPATTGPAPAFNELLLPPSPLYLDKVLSPADIAQARQLIALVRELPIVRKFADNNPCEAGCHLL